MAKKRKTVTTSPPVEQVLKQTLIAPSANLDPLLASLFANSSGPVVITPAAQGRRILNKSARETPIGTPVISEENASASQSLSDGGSERSTTSISSAEEQTFSHHSRKRRRLAASNDIEGDYMKRLANEDSKSRERRGSNEDLHSQHSAKQDEAHGSEPTHQVDGQEIPQHESLNPLPRVDERDKANRTVFLGNVSTQAIKSKSARKELTNHLSSFLADLSSETGPHKVDSLRFRSTAFASDAGPRRAAYAKKSLMDETTHSTNAYVVYTTEAAAQKSVGSLNGTIVLDRHLRADLINNPARTDHRRCVFIGNLGFVDEEMEEGNEDPETGTTERKRKAKQPADAEEGLWRTFSKAAGKVESVRVVRDRDTRIGKGIAYVQFSDDVAVEKALLLDGKKFPPLLPRKLRVTRAKRPAKKNSLERGGGKPGSRRGASGRGDRRDGLRPRPGQKKDSFVFEGHRATASEKGRVLGQKSNKRHADKPKNRSSRRGAAFKAAGGKAKMRAK